MQHIPTNSAEKLQILKGCRYFEGASDAVLQELAQDTYLCRFDSAELIFCEGESCAGLHIVQSGSVKLYKVSPQGREMIIKTLGENDSFNEVPVFDHGENPISAAAINECQLWIVPCESIRRVMAEHPEMAQAIILNLSKNLRMLVGLVEELSFYQVTNRLARLIHQLPAEQLQGKRDERLTQDALAARLGSVREVVARSLKELERSGAITLARRKIEIANEEILRDWAQLPE